MIVQWWIVLVEQQLCKDRVSVSLYLVVAGSLVCMLILQPENKHFCGWLPVVHGYSSMDGLHFVCLGSASGPSGHYAC